jgi:mannose-1-phosphate guanylyltransferase
VGRYTALYELNQKDAHGNVAVGNVIIGNDCRNNFIINRLPSPLVVMGTSDSVVVHSEAGSLVSKLKDAGRIGEIYKSQLY